MLYKFQCAVARFMYGRNGMDQLNMALFWVYIALSVVRAIVAAVLRSALIARAFELALTGLLLGLCLGRRTRRFSGDVFALWCAGYGSFRLIAELFWRGDDRGLGTRVLPPSALISLLLIAAAIGFAWRGRHSARLKTSGQTSP